LIEVANAAERSSHRMNIGIRFSAPGPNIGGAILGRGFSAEAAVVVTVTWAEALLVPSSVAEVGAIEHVARDGAPLQLSNAVCLKPFRGVMVSV
jgi:hypothetical protein